MIFLFFVSLSYLHFICFFLPAVWALLLPLFVVLLGWGRIPSFLHIFWHLPIVPHSSAMVKDTRNHKKGKFRSDPVYTNPAKDFPPIFVVSIHFPCSSFSGFSGRKPPKPVAAIAMHATKRPKQLRVKQLICELFSGQYYFHGDGRLKIGSDIMFRRPASAHETFK